jgi:diguanylate cyclase (GGDEF)-like protein
MKSASGLNLRALLDIRFKIKGSIFEETIKTHLPLVLDSDNTLAEKLSHEFYETFRLKNTLAVPIYSKGKLLGILGVGSRREGFAYRKEDLELLNIFARQVAISVENDILMQRVAKLEIKDALTGLYNKAFIYRSLEEEIKRSLMYQRPCAFIIFDVDDFDNYRANFGILAVEATLKKISSIINSSVTEIDRVARYGDNEFAILLPEKNKRQALEVADQIRRKVEGFFADEPDRNKRITVSGGVSENPLDGNSPDELIKKAEEFLKQAKSQRRNNIVGV